MAAPVLGPASHSAAAARGPGHLLVRCARRVEVALARPLLLVALLAVYVPFFVVYFATSFAFSLPRAASACKGQPILDQRWGYGSSEVADYVRTCGAAGRAAIAAQQDADLVYPALFGAVLTVAFALLLRAMRMPGHRWAHVLVLLPALSAGADYLENTGIRVLMAAYPQQPPVIPAMSAITMVKLATGWTCIGALVVLAVAASIGRLRTMRTGSASTVK